MNSHGIVVVIATAGRRPVLLERTLDSLSSCALPPQYVETIVVENGRQQAVREITGNYTNALRARYLYLSEANKSRALNHAIARIPNSLVIFFDDDVRVEANTIAVYAEAAARARSNAFFGGPVGIDYEEEPTEWLRRYLPASTREWSPWAEMKVIEPSHSEYFLGFNWAGFASDITRVGSFAPEFGPGSVLNSTGDETELQIRLVKNGVKRLYLPEARVSHYVPKRDCTPEWALQRAYREGLARGMIVSTRPWYRQLLYRFSFGLKSAREILTRRERDEPATFRFRYLASLGQGISVGLRSRVREKIVEDYQSF